MNTQFDDASRLGFKDFKLKGTFHMGFTRGRHMAMTGGKPAADRVVLVIFRKGGACRLIKVINVESAIDFPRALVDLDQDGLVFIIITLVFVVDLAHDFFKEVLNSGQACCASVLVNDNRHMHFCLLEVSK